MTKLTDTQTIVLTGACGRTDGFLTRPEALNRTAAVKVAAKLLAQSLVQEVPAKLGWPIWRMDEEGRAFSLKILKAGRALVQAEAKSVKSADKLITEDAAERSTTRLAAAAQPAQGSGAVDRKEKPGSKREIVLALLQRQEGTTIDDLMAATGWLPHSTRAALSVMRKAGVAIERSQDPKDQTSVYRIVQASVAVAA